MELRLLGMKNVQGLDLDNDYLNKDKVPLAKRTKENKYQ